MKKIKKITFISGSRADFFISEGLINTTAQFFDTTVILHAGHLQHEYGLSANIAQKKIAKLKIIKLNSNIGYSNNRSELNLSFASQIKKIGFKLKIINPDAVILIGDRTETLAASCSCMLRSIPIIHVHGGELSFGSMDEKLRHAITKLSSYHFVSHKSHKKRLIQLGEDKRRIKVIGSPSLKNISESKLNKKNNILNKKFILVTLNSYLTKNETYFFSKKLFSNLDKINILKVVTFPNPDLHNSFIITELEKRKKRHDYKIYKHLGDQYPSFLKSSEFIIGNSSSGIIEAPFFNKYFLNIGSRQDGRIYSKKTTINYKMNSKKNLLKIIKEVLKRKKIKANNLYFNKNCNKIFLKALKNINIDNLVYKKFYDL